MQISGLKYNNMGTVTFQEKITFNVIHCANCNLPFGVPEDFEERKRKTHEEFYCPNGHNNYYPYDNEAEKLRKELKRKEQELADEAIKKIQMQNQLEEVNRKLRRLKNGVCPCCNRSFHNLQQHLKNQHPEFVKKD